MLKVATYCRVSTSSEDQLNSFERQMQMYNEEILLHDDWELYNSYYDKGLSGTEVMNRPGFLEMKEAGLNREYDILITREVSRLSRNIQHFYEFVRPLVKKNIQIFSLMMRWIQICRTLKRVLRALYRMLRMKVARQASVLNADRKLQCKAEAFSGTVF